MTKPDEAIEAGARAMAQWIMGGFTVTAEDVGFYMPEATAAYHAILKVIAEPDAEMVEAGARQLFASDCAINDDIVNWGRATDEAPRGYKTEVMAWEALAHMCLRAMIHKLMGGGE